MGLQLRQVAMVARELQPVVDDLRAILDLEVCFVDEDVSVFGLENSLLPIGTNFIEVVAPIREGTAAGRYLTRRGGDGGYMVITQASGADAQAAHRDRAIAMGIRVAWEKEHAHGRYMQLNPRDTGGAFFEIDYADANDLNGDWPPAGGSGWQNKVQSTRVRTIDAVEIQASDPPAVAQRWSRVADVALERDEAGRIALPLNNARIRFVPIEDGRGEGLAAVDVDVADRRSLLAEAQQRDAVLSESVVVIGGVRFNLI